MEKHINQLGCYVLLYVSMILWIAPWIPFLYVLLGWTGAWIRAADWSTILINIQDVRNNHSFPQTWKTWTKRSSRNTHSTLMSSPANCSQSSCKLSSWNSKSSLIKRAIPWAKFGFLFWSSFPISSWTHFNALLCSIRPHSALEDTSRTFHWTAPATFNYQGFKSGHIKTRSGLQLWKNR